MKADNLFLIVILILIVLFGLAAVEENIPAMGIFMVTLFFVGGIRLLTMNDTKEYYLINMQADNGLALLGWVDPFNLKFRFLIGLHWSDENIHVYFLFREFTWERNT